MGSNYKWTNRLGVLGLGAADSGLRKAVQPCDYGVYIFKRCHVILCDLQLSFGMYVHMYACVFLCIFDMYCGARVQRSEDSLRESAFSFCLTGPRAQTQVIRLGGKHLYQLSHVPSTAAQLKTTKDSRSLTDRFEF